MEYTVLARRFRPQAFGEVVGQEMVAQALQNAISGDRVAHAYLFTGARGVGKTSMARILAKSLNCPVGTHGVPCNQCDICQGISAGSDVDVLEIDGASNRGIEDIRALRSNVNVKSMRSRYKIYIIDEVHMLTREAFNALLKTLEEPPPNVKFVFCTTEAQKLPDTILSRCQRFDFSTIATAAIMERLRQIAQSEGVDVEAAALELVARRAAGSMRDSQSLFDQLLAFGNQKLTAEDVHRLLGIASDDRLIDVAAALIERRRGDVLELFNDVMNAGVQITEFVDQLLNYFRDLMLLASGAKDVGLLSVSEGRRALLTNQAKTWGLRTCLAALQILAEARGRMRGVPYARALAELALIRISLLEDLEALSEIVQQLKTGKGLTAGNLPPYSPGAQSRAPQTDLPPAPLRDESADRNAHVEKKNESPPPVNANPIQEVPPPIAATVPFQPGFETELLAQLISNMTDTTKAHFKNVKHLAISGPNHLVITFPKRYDLSYRYLERPDQVGRIEKIVQQITGKPVRFTVKIDETDADLSEVVVPAPGSRNEQTARRPEIENDPFVQKVIAAFDATVTKAT